MTGTHQDTPMEGNAVPTGAPNKETDTRAKCQVQARQNTIAGALVEMTLRPPLPVLALFRVLIVFW